MTYSATKFEVAMSNRLGDTFYMKIHYCPLTLGVKVIQIVAQYPLHHVTYSVTKFEVATTNGLGDTFTRNLTDTQTDGLRTDFGTKLIYPFFLKNKAGITNSQAL